MSREDLTIEEWSDKEISWKTFQSVKEIAYKSAGLKFDHSKITLVKSRLARRLRAFDLSSFAEYVELLKKTPSEIQDFINALTTNKTEFFREIAHFTYLKNVFLKNLALKVGKKSYTIYAWSAASSNGHEAYTMALILKEFCRDHPNFDYRILGTDIDTNVINFASDALYSSQDVSTIPPNYLSGSFLKGKKENSGWYLVSDDIRERVKFRHYNLVYPSAPMNVEFDFVFLRNVLIYFDVPTIQRVIDNIRKNIRETGLLFIGHSESLNWVKTDLKSLGTSIYGA